MKRPASSLRAELVARDTFLARVSQGLAMRVRELDDTLAGAPLSEPARAALAELVGFSRELGVIAREDADVSAEAHPVIELGEASRVAIDVHKEKFSRPGRPVRVMVDGDVHVACARADVELVLCELLSNAAKYGKGAIDVHIGASRSHARLTIRDRGSGVPPGLRRRVLGRFVRGSGARPGTGFGVGLWLVKKVARGYGGDLKLLKGAAFEVSWPIARAPGG